jgi:GxxExxY protein
MTMLHEKSTKEVIGAAFEVYNHLGYGFLEKVYKNAMKVELDLRGVPNDLEAAIKVFFKSTLVGDYFADIFVDQRVLVELKTAKNYNPSDEAQLLNELKATGVKVGLLINFGKDKVEFKRMIF